MKSLRGFTLIELMISIGVIAISSTTFILILNPVEIFAQARDSQRIADLEQMRQALVIYLVSVKNPSLGDCSKCWVFNDGSLTITPNCGGRHVESTFEVNSQNNNGTGWIPVDFTSIGTGVPLTFLPIDPSQSGVYFYTYACDLGKGYFELTTRLESKMYGPGGPKDLAIGDAGDQDMEYEVSNATCLNL